MINILTKILSIIYPQTCSICGKLNSKALCIKCEKKLQKEFKFKKDDYSKDKSKNFMEHYYFFKYENLIRSQILALKFQEKPYVSETIEKFLENNRKNLEKLKKYDIIIMVPISRKRQKERGYNQSQLISRNIVKILKIKEEKNIIFKIKNTVPQSTLNKIEREKNAKGAYEVKNVEKIRNKKILIFDDIYTTGNTVNECANKLVEAGIKKEQLGVLTLAKD